MESLIPADFRNWGYGDGGRGFGEGLRMFGVHGFRGFGIGASMRMIYRVCGLNLGVAGFGPLVLFRAAAVF